MTRQLLIKILPALFPLALLAPAHADLPEQPAAEPIPWSEIGTRAGDQYEGDGLSVVPCQDGAVLHSIFQRLRGKATVEGLWLESTAEGAEADRFRVTATAVGRLKEDEDSSLATRAAKTVLLSDTGHVQHDGGLVRFIRPDLIEEYSTSIDGVRQDFLVLERPDGEGELRIELAVNGARAEEAGFGARLVLENSGREIGYSRLRVEDAEGRVLPARIAVSSPNRLVIFVADAGAVYPLRVDPTFSDENWISMGGLLGANYSVLAVVAGNDGMLFAGGSFSMIGDVFANRIARWDGTSWSALGPGLNEAVNALAVSEGELYAGGEFWMAGDVSASRVARWDGSSWSALGSGMDRPVYALAVSGGELYAGGGFITAGGVSANRIARWDGNAWSELGSGMDNRVSRLAVTGGGLYAGGVFTTAGGVSANRIARWNGSSWSALGEGVSGGWSSWVGGLAVSGDKLYVGGEFTTAGGISANNIAQWDGSSWSALGDGVSGRIHALAVSGGNLYAGGSFSMASGVSARNIARWDGTSWSALGPGVSGAVRALAVSVGGLYAGGDFEMAGEVNASRIARWDHSAWSPLGPGMDSGVYTLAVSGDDLYVGGDFTMAGGVIVNRIARWDGSSWSALGSGMNKRVLALAVSGGDLYAGGEFWTAGGVSASRIARWDGSSWSALGSGMSRPFGTGTVRALAVFGGNLYAGGDFTVAGDVNASRIARWNGIAWSALGSGMAGGRWATSVCALAVSGGSLYVGGEFETADEMIVNYIARWNGSSWSALGSGMDWRVSALAVSGDDLYAGGLFTTAGGVTVNRIARWDGSSWFALGSGLNASVHALVVSGSDLYAGGNFGIADGMGIARWDGSSWSAVGSGMNRSVDALTVFGRDLYAGGEFFIVGGKVATYLAKTNIAVSLSNGRVVEQRQRGTVVGSLSAIEMDETAGPTAFTLVIGPGDNDNASFIIEGDRLKTGVLFDYHVQNLFSIRVRATYADGTEADKVFLLRVDRDGFLAWAETLPADQRGKTDDPGGHGIPNLLRYAFGMDPIFPEREALPRPVLSEVAGEGEPGFHLTLIYTRRTDDPDLIFTPEGSEDLDTWTPLADAEEISGSDGLTETVIVTDPEPVAAKPTGFLRVRVDRDDF